MEEGKDHSELILLCLMHKFFFVPMQISEAARIGSKHSMPTEVHLFLETSLQLLAMLWKVMKHFQCRDGGTIQSH